MRFLPSVNITDPKLETKTSLGSLRNPIGLAGGFDKTGDHLEVLQKLGFGYLIAGTITLDPWPGHPKPRIVRNPPEKTMVNALGFPNRGADDFIKTLKTQKLKVPVIASVSGRTIEAVIGCYEKLQPHVAGIELNLSSPNTSKLKDLREMETFKDLAQTMRSKKNKPTYLKVPPYVDEDQYSKILPLVRLWADLGFEGVTEGNAIPVNEPRVSIGTGGFSGPPLFPNLLRALKKIRESVPRDFEVNAVGGISNAQNVRDALASGANTVQLLTSLVFEGPGLVKTMLRDLLKNSPVVKNEQVILK